MDELKNLNRNIKDLVTGLKYEFEKLASNIGGHINDAMTDEMAVVKDTVMDGFDVVKSSGLKVYGFFAKSFSFEKSMVKETKVQSKLMNETMDTIKGDTATTEELKKQTALLSGTAKIAKKDETRKRGMMKSKGKGMWDYLMDFLGLPFLLAGAAIGAIVGVIVAPFRLIAALFKELGMFKFLGKILNMIPGVGKIFTWLSEVFSKIMNLPILRSLKAGFLKGFTKLFWPLQIIMSVIDFIEGFQKTDGDIVDKIKAGVKNVVMKFFELPVTLLEKAWNWLAKELGFEGVKEGTFMKGFGGAYDYVQNELLPKIWDWFTGILKWAWDKIKSAFAFMQERDFDVAKIIGDLIKKIFDAIIEYAPRWVRKALGKQTEEDLKAEAEAAAIFQQRQETYAAGEQKKIELMGIGNAKQLLKERGSAGQILLDKVEKQTQDQTEQLKLIAKLLTDMKTQGVNQVMQNVNNNGVGGSNLNAPPSESPSKGINFHNTEHIYGR